MTRFGRTPILRALAAQAGALLVTAAVVVGFAGQVAFNEALLLQGVLAAALGWWLGLPWWWAPIQVAFPWAVSWQSGAAHAAWWYALAFVAMVLLFGGGLWTRVPLYNSNRAAWAALLGLLPPHPGVRFVDLGAGLAGPLAYLARQRPDARFVGVEASPLVWVVAWLRTLPVRRNCQVRLGSLWSEDLGAADVVHVFLSPVPMPAVWQKAQTEMRPGTLLISNTFEVPGVPPVQRIDLPGRADACLMVWRL